MKDTTVNILGTEYTIKFGTIKDFPALCGVDGYTDNSIHLIVIDDMSMEMNAVDAKKDLESYKKSVLRHEIMHAFLSESGLCNNSNKSDSWAVNEEMIDWFAIQSPKIFNVFQELGVI